MKREDLDFVEMIRLSKELVEGRSINEEFVRKGRQNKEFVEERLNEEFD